jgi:uncharacterized membrane protein
MQNAPQGFPSITQEDTTHMEHLGSILQAAEKLTPFALLSVVCIVALYVAIKALSVAAKSLDQKDNT